MKKIWQPKVGMEVQLRYNQRLRKWPCPHLACGRVTVVGVGKGPINTLVEMNDGRKLVVPRGHLFENNQMDLFDGYLTGILDGLKGD